MLLSIIIINYNTFQLTSNCIRSIKETTMVEHEIILVDNSSKECAPEIFLEVFPDIKLVALKENSGFGRANNRGVEESNGKYLLLLNSDTIVNANTIDQTVGYLEAHPEVDILGCKVLFDNQSVQKTVVKDEGEYRLLSAIKYLIKRNTFFVETRLFLHNRKERKMSQGQRGVEHQQADTETVTSKVEANYHEGKRIGSLLGVFLLLKRSVYVESKGFDPDFFMYYEEIEWFVKRLRKRNIVYYRDVSIKHLHGGSDIHSIMNQQFFVSQHLFWYKMGYGQYFFYLLFTLLDIPSRLLVKLLYRRSRPSQDIPAMLKALPYFFQVIRYPNGYGTRPQMLKLNFIQKNNL